MTLLFILFGLFFVFAFIGTPVAYSLGIAAMCGMSSAGVSLMSLPQKMFTAIDSFPFMAIPFFILAGKLMEMGGISRRLVTFANTLLCKVRGGLALATVAACAFFAALSGSSPGTVAAIGSVMYPEMCKRGYDENFAAGLITISGGLGPIIPPSIVMVTLGVTTGISISSMFMGGLLVGVILALALMICAYIICLRKGYGTYAETFSFRKITESFLSAIPALGMPVIILGGIYGGIFTPTEAAVVSVVYALVVGVFVYHELKAEDLVEIFYDAALSSCTILMIIALSVPFSWIFARQGLANMIITFAVDVFQTPMAFLIFVYIVLLIFGTFMEANAIVLLLMPFLYPVSQQLGINPIHFGVMSSVALVIGCATPPVAVNIYTAISVTKLSLGRIVRGMMPFFLTMVILTFVLLFFPQITVFLPNLIR